jgi:hypothetical protein
MTVDFVGDWCFSGQEKNTADYTLPSWMMERIGECTKIFSVDKWGFYTIDRNESCYPVNMQLKQDRAPSGTAYIAKIAARCHGDGPTPRRSGRCLD